MWGVRFEDGVLGWNYGEGKATMMNSGTMRITPTMTKLT
jgi:hypothetical protein